MKKVTIMIAVGLCLYAVVGAATSASGGEKDVLVVNSPAQAVPVNVVNTLVPVAMGGREPFSLTAHCDTGEFGSCGGIFYTVPGGKQLVVEYFSCSGILPAGTVLTCRVFATGGASAYLPTSPLAPSGVFNNASWIAAGQPVRVYVAEAKEVHAGVFVGGGPLPGEPLHIQFSFIGYLEAAP